MSERFGEGPVRISDGELWSASWPLRPGANATQQHRGGKICRFWPQPTGHPALMSRVGQGCANGCSRDFLRTVPCRAVRHHLPPQNNGHHAGRSAQWGQWQSAAGGVSHSAGQDRHQSTGDPSGQHPPRLRGGEWHVGQGKIPTGRRTVGFQGRAPARQIGSVGNDRCDLSVGGQTPVRVTGDHIHVPAQRLQPGHRRRKNTGAADNQGSAGGFGASGADG